MLSRKSLYDWAGNQTMSSGQTLNHNAIKRVDFQCDVLHYVILWMGTLAKNLTGTVTTRCRHHVAGQSPVFTLPLCQIKQCLQFYLCFYCLTKNIYVFAFWESAYIFLRTIADLCLTETHAASALCWLLLKPNLRGEKYMHLLSRSVFSY